MLGLVENFKSFVKVQYVANKAIIDNPIFRLHYRMTVTILFVCSAFVTAYTFFGEPIECIGGEAIGKGKEFAKVINTYCYYLGKTFILPRTQNSNEKNPGLGTYQDGDEIKYHYFYRWVPYMLFLQGVLFYMPHWIWKNWEGKRITNLTKDLRGPVANVGEKHLDGLKPLARYAADSLHTHNAFALQYFICEILNFINVIVNIYVIDSFLGGEFMHYGFDVLSFTETPQEERIDPMIRIFPRLTKCEFDKFGPSGGIVKADVMCVLALNNLNEKIYIFLWFWLIFLTFVSILPIAYYVAIFISPEIRKRILQLHYIYSEKSRIEELIPKTEIGDFFLWELLARNMSSKCYHEFINELYRQLCKDERKIIRFQSDSDTDSGNT